MSNFDEKLEDFFMYWTLGAVTLAFLFLIGLGCYGLIHLGNNLLWVLIVVPVAGIVLGTGKVVFYIFERFN